MGVGQTSVTLRKEELLRLLIAGKRTREAARILGLAMNTVRTYIRCPEFQQKLWNQDQTLWARIDEEIRVSKLTSTLRIQEMSEVALERIAQLMESDDEGISLRASQDTLDRNPDFSKHTRSDVSTALVVIDPTQLALAAQAAQEMEQRRLERNAGVTIDADTQAQ